MRSPYDRPGPQEDSRDGSSYCPRDGDYCYDCERCEREYLDEVDRELERLREMCHD